MNADTETCRTGPARGSGTVALTLLALVVCSPGGANGQEGVDSATGAGYEIAEARCGRCHAIGASGDSPLEEAPPFRTFAAKWPLESLEEALAEGIMVGHVMPEFIFTPEEIGTFIAYLHSLRGAEAVQ